MFSIHSGEWKGYTFYDIKVKKFMKVLENKTQTWKMKNKKRFGKWG